MSEIAPEELYRRLRAEDEDPFVLDVRYEEDFEAWHVPGSVNVDVFDELAENPEAAATALADLPEDRPIVTICVAGVRSQEATALLRERGYDATTLVDGMQGWSRVHAHAPIDADISGTLLQVARPGKGCLSYVLVSDGDAAVFDPSHDVEVYEDLLAEYGATLLGVFDTHAHADHVSGGPRLARRQGVPYYLHPADATAVDAEAIEGGESFAVGDVSVRTIHTPGHSPGGITYDIGGEALLTGDTLFHGSVGRVELGVEAGLQETDVEATAATLFDSLTRLTDRQGDPFVLPAHDQGTPDPPEALRLSEVRSRTDELRLEREAFVAHLADAVPDHPPNFERIKRVNAGIEAVSAEEVTGLEAGPNRCAIE